PFLGNRPCRTRRNRNAAIATVIGDPALRGRAATRLRTSRLRLTGDDLGFRAIGRTWRSIGRYIACDRSWLGLIVWAEIDRRLRYSLLLSHQAVLTSCIVSEIPPPSR